jgi:hypothetical protein
MRQGRKLIKVIQRSIRSLVKPGSNPQRPQFHHRTLACEPLECRALLSIGPTPTGTFSAIGDAATVGSNAEISRIIDDSDAGFSTTGQWSSATGQGFDNGVHFSKGTGADVATWTFTVTEDGTYQVAATWSPYATDGATNAQYKYSLDGSPLTVLTTGDRSNTVNQHNAARDFVYQGAGWQNFATNISVSGATSNTPVTLLVQLSDNADNYVIADAVRLAKVDVDSSNVQVTDDPAGTPTGSWQSIPGEGFGDSVHFIKGTSTDTYTWTPTIPGGTPSASTQYALATTWSPYPTDRATNATYDLSYVPASGSPVPLGTVTVNQSNSEPDFVADGVGWKNLGTYTLPAGATFTVTLQGGANNYVVADAIRVEKLPSGSTSTPFTNHAGGAPVATAVDDTSSAFTKSGSGWKSSSVEGYLGGVSFDNHPTPGATTDSATWALAPAASASPGYYEVFATWSPYPTDRATDASYLVQDDRTSLGGGLVPLATVQENQKFAATDLVFGGVGWQSLGTFYSATGKLQVTLMNGANNYVIADALMCVNVTSINNAPTGTDTTVTTLEDTAYAFTAADFGFSDPNDTTPNSLLAVKITTLPGAGTLQDNGVNVTAGQFVSVTDINAGELVFTPVANANGAAYATFTFQVQDNGGTANGGMDLDPTPKTMTIDVTPVNDAPVGTNNTVTTLEDTPYPFTAADFGFSDPNDAPPNNLLAVKVTTLPGAGTLQDNGVNVTAGQFVSVTDINAGEFVFVPAADANGAAYAAFTFQVQDDGGTANGGVDLDPTAKTMTIDVTPVNDPPVRTAGSVNNLTVLEDSGTTSLGLGTLAYGPGGGADEAGQTLTYKVTVVPSATLGKIVLADGVTVVTANTIYTLPQLQGMQFQTITNANGGPATFAWTVQDNGGTANGGMDTLTESLTISVTPVNDAPLGTNNTVTTLEDAPYTFTAADFGFSDPNDTPANTLLAVKITTLPGAGTLKDNGVSVTTGQFVSVADINAGHLVFTPAANANGAAYAAFTFQVQDNGGTANGGVDLDPTAKTMTINVTPVNDAPVGTNNTVTTLEDTPYAFTAADFGFSDPNDTPANTLLAVKVTTLPSAGTLQDNGVNVTAGQFVSVADINAGNLVFTPAANANGAAYAAFTFQVQDNGGTTNGGVDLDPAPKTMTINVTAVNDAPVGHDATITMLENTAFTFTTTNFGFSDPNDTPPNTLLAVKVTTLPGAGTLQDNGVNVTAGQFVSVADINAGNLVFTPAANATGAPYTVFTFQVQDNGGTANGGVDLDVTPKTITINVTA